MEARAIINVIDNLESTSEIDALSANQGRVLKGFIDDLDVANTGWANIPLADGIEAYSANAIPQYRKINGVVYLRGAVKGITGANTVIGTLPTGYRPVTCPYNFVQLTSTQGNSANFTRMKVATNGEIVMEAISSGMTATYDSTRWYPIATSFVAD